MISGGGHGYTSRRLGLAIDNLVSVELVTSNGDVLNVGEHSTDSDERDLFWACKGAAFNMGIVTWFTLRVHPVGHQPISKDDTIPRSTVMGGMMVYPMELAKQVTAKVADIISSKDENVWSRDGLAWQIYARGPGKLYNERYSACRVMKANCP